MPRLGNAQLYELGLITPMCHFRREGSWFIPVPGRTLRLPQIPGPAFVTLPPPRGQEGKQGEADADHPPDCVLQHNNAVSEIASDSLETENV